MQWLEDMADNTFSNKEPTVTQEQPIRLSRSPHPYRRWSIQEQTSSESQERAGYLPSPSPTPPHGSDNEGPTSTRGRSKVQLRDSPSESGTEPDDDQKYAIRALPAPPARLRKGLRGAEDGGFVGHPAPLLTPSQLHEDVKELSPSYFDPERIAEASKLQESKLREAQERFYFRRRAELIRRLSELLSLCSIGYVVLSEARVRLHVSTRKTELYCHFIISILLLCLYPFRLLLRPTLSSSARRTNRLELPATFDPAPLLYPPFLPVMVSLSLANTFPSAILPNLILGLSALPSELVPCVGLPGYFNILHWALSCISLYLLKTKQSQPITSSEEALFSMASVENLTLLFPLHHTLLEPLYYLTTSSLLPAELQLASISLINLLVLSRSPQSAILGILLWIGGLGIFVTCTKVLQWNVALERIPNWRFRRAGRVIASATTFVNTLSEDLRAENGNEHGTSNLPPNKAIASNASSGFSNTPNGLVQSPDSSQPSRSAAARRRRRISDITNLNLSPFSDSNENEDISASSPASPIVSNDPLSFNGTLSRHKRRLSQSAQAYLSFTPVQAFWRKFAYATYTYAVLLIIILGPVRVLVGRLALNGHEPFGWAMGFLFSDVPEFHTLIKSLHLETWIIPSDRKPFDRATCLANWVERYRQAVGLPTTRLLLFSYWTAVIALGLVIVLKGLGPFPEVDTRRKVFHGMMVLMLLPTTYIDPCFLSLGLVLVFVVFLLLDLFRASQLKPVSKPLATFLAPYVDGRDLRGPVVVSHIFLLIGCAIPLWLSLAGTERKETPESDPWKGWELETRDVSMVAGVVCVGMGDAAASLVGRRFGRRKWPWAGGKSLEGSAAFAGAVTVGLVFGKTWLELGQWKTPYHEDNTSIWPVICGKAFIAASGASFTEAVLTGANDNVVVPIVLWLLVRGLGI